MRTMKTKSKLQAVALCAFSLVCVSAFAAPLIQAHRGSRGEYDDNAAGGFARCLARGILGYETDIRFTKDHQLVIMHDKARYDKKWLKSNDALNHVDVAIRVQNKDLAKGLIEFLNAEDKAVAEKKLKAAIK